MPRKLVDPVAAIREKRRRRAARAARAKGSDAPYSSSAWSRIRQLKLTVHPICELCDRHLASEVHHRNANPWDNRWANLASVCKACHASLTLTERLSRQRGAETARFGISLSPSDLRR